MMRKANRIPRLINAAVRTGLEDGLTWTYGLSNPFWRNNLSHPFRHSIQIHSLLSQMQEGSAYIVRGKAVGSSQFLTVGFTGIWETGQRNTLPYFEHLLFEEGTVERQTVGSFPLWQLRSRSEQMADRVDLLCINANRLLMWQPGSGEWITGPAEMRMVFDYHAGESWEDVERRMKGQRANLKKLKKAAFSYHTSSKDEDFSLFYHHYYVPMVKSRYKDYGDINNEDGLRRVFKNGGVLHFIKDAQGETVSVEFDLVKNGVVYGLLTGVREGNPELVQKGALAACYYFSFHYGFQNGFQRNDAGVCQPFLSDGILKHKRLWGYEPLPNDWRPQHLLLWAPRSTSSAVDWLKENLILPQFARYGGSAMESSYAMLATAEKANNQ